MSAPLTNVFLLLLNDCSKDGVVLVHPTCGPTQADDIPGYVRYQTYEVHFIYYMQSNAPCAVYRPGVLGLLDPTIEWC